MLADQRPDDSQPQPQRQFGLRRCGPNLVHGDKTDALSATEKPDPDVSTSMNESVCEQCVKDLFAVFGVGRDYSIRLDVQLNAALLGGREQVKVFHQFAHQIGEVH